MIEMNKKKNEEMKGILKWLKCEIGAKSIALFTVITLFVDLLNCVD